MGDPSYFLAVIRNFVLNWDILSRARQNVILQQLNEYCQDPLDELPATFEELMKVFDERKFFGYLVPPIVDILTEWLPVFPEAGIAVFIAYSTPAVFVFDPNARRHEILRNEVTWPNIDHYEYQSMDRADADRAEEKAEENPSSRSSKRKKAGKRAAASITSRFRSEIMLPLLQLPTVEEVMEFLDDRGFCKEQPLSKEERDLVAMIKKGRMGLRF